MNTRKKEIMDKRAFMLYNQDDTILFVFGFDEIHVKKNFKICRCRQDDQSRFIFNHHEKALIGKINNDWKDPNEKNFFDVKRVLVFQFD